MKKIIPLIFCFCSVLVFSACSLTGSSTSSSVSNSTKQTGSFLKSFDGGKNWENKVKIDEKTNIGTFNILSIAVDPKDGNIIYAGTESNGLLVTRNGAESWEKLVFPLTKIYGLAINKNDNQIIYASGVLNSRAKIFRSNNGGKDWTEIYTEPANDSVISRLEISQKNPAILYSGTSEGMIFKTTDGGQTWKNIFKANGPIIGISFDASNDDVVYFGVSKGTILRTMDGGVKIEDLSRTDLIRYSSKKAQREGKTNDKIFSFNDYSIKADPQNSGILYAGTDSGLYRGSNFGRRWDEVNILESSKKFPIRAIAINPQNSNEILYSSSAVIYHSEDGGATWFTFQLNTDKVVEDLRFNPLNAGTVFAGLRKI